MRWLALHWCSSQHCFCWTTLWNIELYLYRKLKYQVEPIEHNKYYAEALTGPTWYFKLWMNEVVTYIPPFIRLIVTRSQSRSQYIPQTNWWAAYLGRTVHSKDTIMFMVNFLFSNHHLFGLNHFYSFCIIHILFSFAHIHLFIFIFAVRAGCLYVTDTLSTPTITEPPSVECQDLLIPCQIECMYSQNRPRFIVPSERLSNKVQVPCLRGLRNDQ